MLLHLLRHAHAGDPAKWTGPDATRPLSEKGREQADRLGRLLAEQGFTTDLVLSSPKVRARETAEIVAATLGVPVVLDERLGGALDIAAVETILSDHGDPQRPVFVGHDPDFTDLVGDLAGGGTIPMRKGAFARLEADRPLRSGEAMLRWLIPPDALRPER